MTSAKIEIRNIRVEEAKDYWALRLEALQKHPNAFGAAYEESVLLPMEEVEKRIGQDISNYILGAFTTEGQLIGTVGFKREQSLKLKHKAFIWGVYVSENYRGQGIAKQLMVEVIRRGKQLEGLKQVTLYVVTTNGAAIELYRKLGFETYGVERNALEFEGQGYDEEMMVHTYKEQ
ncbi:GNAT family N-acetyltransferase [Paenibacillus sp. Soil724D2]|uniref:GNAT family N-acetyltransferase n=1 Tax=Paenibacillus sp. (strain Soil724D2) TaxID=1736392 RepID=UPI000713EA9C|nr:GNAT family N-acetyltransferase [Paenibacillus sp. Soil724D2]KRE43222.1 GNAT family acetyltransferase [Paenibacillus sp. Soil724D2]